MEWCPFAYLFSLSLSLPSSLFDLLGSLSPTVPLPLTWLVLYCLVPWTAGSCTSPDGYSCRSPVRSHSPCTVLHPLPPCHAAPRLSTMIWSLVSFQFYVAMLVYQINNDFVCLFTNCRPVTSMSVTTGYTLYPWILVAFLRVRHLNMDFQRDILQASLWRMNNKKIFYLLDPFQDWN